MAVLTGTSGKLPSYSPSQVRGTSDAHVLNGWRSMGSLSRAVGVALGIIRSPKSVGRFRPNGTGRKVTGIVDFSGYQVTMSLHLIQAQGDGRRTDDSLLTEVMEILLSRVELDSRRAKARGSSPESWDHPLSAFILLLREIGEMKRQRDPADGAYFNLNVARDILTSELVKHPGDLAKVIHGFRAVSDSGAASANFSNHEASKAAKDFKKCALHALSNGMDVEVLETILKEALVEVTIRS